jgi:ketosteroid isomerase-like protein
MTVRDATLSDTHYETHGDTGIARGQFTLTLVPKAGGEPIQLKGRFVEVCRKIGGKWLYVIDHASVPMPPPPTK